MPKKVSDDNVEIFRKSQKRKKATTSKVSYQIQKAYDIFDKKKINTILDIGYQTESLFKLFSGEIEKYGMNLVKPRGDLNNINFLLCDVSYGLPFKDLSFDAIFAGEIIEHLLDTDFFIKEIVCV